VSPKWRIGPRSPKKINSEEKIQGQSCDVTEGTAFNQLNKGKKKKRQKVLKDQKTREPEADNGFSRGQGERKPWAEGKKKR